MSTMTEVYDWRGRTVVDRDGDKIGTLDEIYLDSQTNEPEWALVHTGLFGTKSSFVPLEGAAPAGEDVRVAYAKDQVKDAPSIDADGALSREEESELYRHYDREYSEDGGMPEATTPATGGRPEGAGYTGGTAGAPGAADDDAMTRSEEEVEIGTTERERGRARLKKYVVTDEVQQTVPVRREEVRVEREPITDANVDEATSGPEISEAEHEVTLREEQPVVEKRTVPKERVRMEKDVETGEEQVSEEVRKERVEVEGDR
jgi:uncharacterized protein (TIGR02271 family)